jgi:hypothetical protein
MLTHGGSGGIARLILVFFRAALIVVAAIGFALPAPGPNELTVMIESGASRPTTVLESLFGLTLGMR